MIVGGECSQGDARSSLALGWLGAGPLALGRRFQKGPGPEITKPRASEPGRRPQDRAPPWVETSTNTTEPGKFATRVTTRQVNASLHISDKGYQVWSAEIERLLRG